MYFGYKHWTLEQIPRCFYVGKGRKRRPFDSCLRSKKWKTVVARYGLRVEVCLGPVNDEEAIKWEIATIIDMKTFTQSYSTSNGTDIACNFTHGGDGASGYKHTEAHKQHISRAMQGHVGHKFTLEQRRQMSLSRKGVPKKSKTNYGKFNRKAVEQLDELGNIIAEFESGAAANRSTGTSCSEISAHCNNQQLGQQRWRFKRVL